MDATANARAMATAHPNGHSDANRSPPFSGDTAAAPTAGPSGAIYMSPPSGLATPYADSVDDLLPESLRHRIELYLVHRFKSSVAASFPSAQTVGSKGIYVWYAMDTAFDHPLLLNAIFALTALYLWIVEPAPRSPGGSQTVESTRARLEGTAGGRPDCFRDVNFAQLHRAYLNLAISQQRDALSALSAANADAVGLTSIMLSTMATCLLPDSSTMEQKEEGGSEYVPPTQWLTLSGAIAVVFEAAIPHLPEGAILNFLRFSSEPSLKDTASIFSPANAAPFLAILEFDRRTRTNTRQLEARSESKAETDATTQETYHRTVALLGSIYHAILADEPTHYICKRVTAFGPMVPQPFIRLLAQRRPRALVILAHYMALVKYIDGYWWLGGRAEMEIHGVQSVLPPEWRWALRWPVAVLEARDNVKLDPRPFYRRAGPDALR